MERGEEGGGEEGGKKGRGEEEGRWGEGEENRIRGREKLQDTLFRTCTHIHTATIQPSD